MPADNPFFETSALPYQLPPFDVIDDSHYLPAFERGFAEQLAEIDEITGSDEPATFANTVAAFEKSGLLLTRVANTFFALHSSDATPEMEAIDEEVTPRFAAHRDAIRMNRALYRRLTAIDADAENLDAESRRLLDKMRKDFVRSGAELDDAQQDELRAMNTELASLTSEFGRKLLADTNDSALVVDDPAELDGLSADAVSAAAHAADELGRSGSYALPLVLPTVQPDLAVLTNPETRRALFDASIVRGARANENDTRKLVSRITSLRSRRAKLLGYQTHADLQIEDQTAGTPEAAGAMLSELAPPAVANGRRELAQLAEQSDSDTAVDPWDVHFLSEEFRRERLSIDTAAFRPYFELDRVLFDGVFYAANRLYGITFDERTDLPTYHDGVRTFEVHDADGSELGLFLGDYFTRPTKRGGAWMTSFVDQSTLLGQKTRGGQQSQYPRAGGRRNDASHARPGAHHVPRVRSCAARAVLERDVPEPLGNERAARLRRVPVAGQRNVDGLARGDHELRSPLRDRRAHAGRMDRQDRRGTTVRSGVRHHRISGRRHARPGLALLGGRRVDRRSDHI